uniref:Elongation of very long chain fatty acids protein n=1 Tax=Meloidogyne floridensis TaxID=298350 RepID=A0A915NNJ3_9BILA
MLETAESQINKLPSLWQNITTQRDFNTLKFVEILTASDFPEVEARKWVDDRYPLTIQLCILYVLVVFGTRHFMRNREPFSLFVPLNVWNLFLAIFSTMGAFKLSYEFFETILTNGLQSSYCHVHNYTLGTNGYWVWLFIVSKMFELMDTVFLANNAICLLFLPYHTSIQSLGHLPKLFGTFIYYYFLRSMKIKVPGPVAKFVTTIQIWQFIISVAILIHLGWLTFVKCDLDSKVFAFAVSMDVSYLILFINFFLHAYVLRGGKTKYRTDKASNGSASAKKDEQSNSVRILYKIISLLNSEALFLSNGELRKNEQEKSMEK